MVSRKIQLELEEKYNKNKLKQLVNCSDVDESDKIICQKILEKLGRKNSFKVKYFVPEKQFGNDEYVGRLYSGSYTYQSINRDIRNYLASDIYDDYDIVNSHSVMLCNLCNDMNLDVSHIQRIRNIDNLASTLGMSKECLKRELMLVRNKSNYYNNDFYLLNKIHDEIYQVIIPKLKEEFSHIMSWVDINKENSDASFLCYVLNFIESLVIENYINFFKTKKIDIDVIIHDGFFINKKKTVDDKMLTDADNYVYEKLGYNVSLVKKDMKSKYFDFDFEADFIDSSVIIDDAYAGNVLYKVSDGEIIYCMTTKSFWFFDKNTGVWSNNEVGLCIKITNEYKDSLYFKQLDSRGNVKVYNYSGETSRRSKMLVFLRDYIQKYDYFIEDKIDTSKHMFLFKNGIFDCRTKSFTPGFNKNIVFLYRLDYDFSYTYNEDIYEKIRDVMFKQPFDSHQLKQNLGEYYAYMLNQYIQGIYTKTFIIAEGISNSGKSTICDALKESFQDYIGEFSADNLIMKKNDEPEKNLKWLIGINNKRILFGMEPSKDENDKSPWNGALIAKVTGGDLLQARRLFENISDRGFKCRASLVLICNIMGKITGDTLAIKNRLLGIEYNKNFTDDVINPEIHMKKDESIRNIFIKKPEFKLAMFWFIINSNQEIKIPGCVNIFASKLLEDSDNELKFIEENFVIGGGYQHYINRQDIEDLCKMNGDNIKYRSLIKRLKNIGVRSFDERGVEQFRENGVIVRRFFNITWRK